MKRSTPKRSRCPTLSSPQSTSSATLSMATGTTRSHLGEEQIDLFIYGRLLTRRWCSFGWRSSKLLRDDRSSLLLTRQVHPAAPRLARPVADQLHGTIELPIRGKMALADST